MLAWNRIYILRFVFMAFLNSFGRHTVFGALVYANIIVINTNMAAIVHSNSSFIHTEKLDDQLSYVKSGIRRAANTVYKNAKESGYNLTGSPMMAMIGATITAIVSSPSQALLGGLLGRMEYEMRAGPHHPNYKFPQKGTFQEFRI